MRVPIVLVPLMIGVFVVFCLLLPESLFHFSALLQPLSFVVFVELIGKEVVFSWNHLTVTGVVVIVAYIASSVTVIILEIIVCRSYHRDTRYRSSTDASH